MVYNLIILVLIATAHPLHLHSNYNYSQVHDQALLSEPILLAQRHSQTVQRPPLIDQFPLRKYELKDTGYQIDDSTLSQADHQLLYQMEPPVGVFAFEVLSVQNYHLLEIRQFQVGMTNPSAKFTICIKEIVVDSEEVRRNDERGILPYCLSPGAQQSFNFSLCVASPQPSPVRITIYFLVQIKDGSQLVEEKAYARKVQATVTQNHFRIETVYSKNCPTSQLIRLHNYQNYEIAVQLQAKKRLLMVSGESIEGQFVVAGGRTMELELEGKPTQFIIHTRSASKIFPSLLLKTYCEEPLIIDYHNIGILTDERMVVDVPLTVSSRAASNLTLLEVILESDSSTVELEQRPNLLSVLPPNIKNTPIGMMRIHSSKHPEHRSTITVTIKYLHLGEQKFVSQHFVYVQIRNAISAGQRKYIDVTKYTTGRVESRFPIKNNLNVPIYLNRITVDQSIFQLSWQSERRKLIYPNHSSEEFSLVYTGSLNLPLSSLKYLALLQFNGHILVPLQITIYDHTLQCLYGNVVYKCAALPPLDFGYFRDSSPKSKQLVVRNWNPEPKTVQVAINQVQAHQVGYNASLRVYRPGLEGEHEVRQSKAPIQLTLKSHQFLLLNIEVQPYDNATCGKLTLVLSTANEMVGTELVVRVENGTIALIPQVVRFVNPLSRQIQYINLVSTYSQEYNIKEVKTNLTGLSVHYNQLPTILGNEWVGMSVVFDPQNENATEPWTSSHLQLKYLQQRKDQDYQSVKYARVHLTTSTDLEANSTIIIERNYPLIIAEAVPSVQLNGVYQIKKLTLKRKKKSMKKDERQQGEFRISLSNVLDVPLKYSLHILSQPKFKDIQKTIKDYQLYSSQELEEGYMCVSQQLKLKWAINAGVIKSIFNLGKLPQEIPIDQILNLDDIAANLNKPKVQIDSNMTMMYLIKSLRNDCKICYRFSHTYYIHRLIDTELVNKILHEEGIHVLAEFVKAEVNHLNDIQLFQLDYLDIHSKVREDFTKFCQIYSDVMFFRFCHYLNVRVSSLLDTARTKLPIDKPSLLLPGHTHTATIAVTYTPGRQSSQFFVVVANNCSRFETYRVLVIQEEPTLRIEPILSQFEVGNGLSDVIWDDRKSYQLPVLLNKADYHQEKGVITGSRTFEVINDGEIEITISHVGIEEKEASCASGEIWLNGLTCQDIEQRGSDWTARAPRHFPFLNRSQQAQAFALGPGQIRNITINFQFSLPKQQMLRTPYFPIYPEQLNYNIYLYDGKGYHFKLNAIFCVGDRDLKNNIQQLQNKGLRVPLVSYHTLNLISLGIICLVLLRLRREEGGVKKREGSEQSDATQHLHKLYRMKKLSKIIRESNYSHTDSSIGHRLVKRAPEKPVHTISQDLILSVREAKHRQLKKYFNQSQESEIGGMIGFNHHLSLSHSMSYQQEEHDNNQQPNLIVLADPSIEEESDPHNHSHSRSQSPPPSSHSSAQPQSPRSSHSAALLAEEGSQSDLPEGEVVDLDDQADEDSSWFDFNQSNSMIGGKNGSQQMQDNEFYNVFRSEIRLKKDPDNNYARYHHHKRD